MELKLVIYSLYLLCEFLFVVLYLVSVDELKENFGDARKSFFFDRPEKRERLDQQHLLRLNATTDRTLGAEIRKEVLGGFG